MSGRPPPPPPPPPGANFSPSNPPRSGGPPPPPPPPGGGSGPVAMSAPYSNSNREDNSDVDDAAQAFDELMNLDTEQELYADEEDEEEEPTPPPARAPASAFVPPPRISPPMAPPSGPPPVPSAPPPVPTSAPPPLPATAPPPPSRPAEQAQAPSQETHEGLAIGAQVYIPDLGLVWSGVTITSKVTRSMDSKVYQIKRANGRTEEVDFATVPFHAVNPTIMADMTALHHIHEPGILYNLRNRFLTQNLPYTYMASALIAVNPLRAFPEPLLSAYVDQPTNKVAPHPFAIAEAAYQNLSFSKINQSIVISGVSGAGKTETAKIVLRYLAARSPDSNGAQNVPFVYGRNSTKTVAPSVLLHKVEGLDEKLVDSSPLLESFGNAKTLRNNNSSRFGKFLKLCFSNGTPPPAPGSLPVPGAAKSAAGMTLIGALVETYLLEKNRVIAQGNGECNFHIFYQLLSSKYAQPLYLRDVGGFTILPPESIKLFAQIKEAATLPTIESALTTLGMSVSSIENLWRTLAGIMHLSNIQFEEHDTPEGTIAVIEHKSMTYLRYTAELWAVDQYALLNLLTKREMFTRGEAYLVQYTVKEANFARDATAKSVYEAVFSSIVRAINRSLVAQDKTGTNAAIDLQKQYFVGVLDIFGFENFGQNGFEQLLINYANEALQNTFNEQLFEKELELFRSENIEFTVSECPNNRQCVSLIAGKNTGIFKTLDSVSRQPKPSDERFCEELHKAFCTEKAHFLPVHRKDMRAKFAIKHYAGEVTYTVCPAAPTALPGTKLSAAAQASAAAAAIASGWISKNNDSIPDALADLYANSKLPEFRALAGLSDGSAGNDTGAAAAPGPGARSSMSGAAPVRRKSVMMKPTIVAIFSKSMDDLNALLLSTTCQFVRCIKPNEEMLPGEFYNIYAMEQIRSLGILQACEVLKVSLPTRITYAQLRTSLADVIRRVAHLFNADSEVVLIACLLRAFNISTDLYRLGKTMVFFRPGQLARLEAVLTMKDASDGGKDGDVIQKIEESHALNQKGLALVRRAESNLQEAQLQFTELEKKFDRLSNKAKNLPEVRSLDFPEDLVQKISLIESFLGSATRKHQNLHVRLSALTASLDDSSQMGRVTPENLVVLQKQCAACNNEVGILAQLLEESQEGYRAFNEQIQSLEDQCGGVGELFQDTMENNDVLYERIQDERNTYEDLAIRAREQAERCQLDKVEALTLQCTEAGKAMNASMQQLQRGIQVALAELDKFESAADNVDFAAVSLTAVGIINKLDHCQRGVASSENTVNQFERNIKTARSGALLEGAAPPPRPSSQAPPMPTLQSPAQPPPLPPKPAPALDGERRTSISYSLKDLAAMRKKKAEDGSGAAGDGARGPVQMAPSARGESDYSSARKPQLAQQPSEPVDDGSLPIGWIEKVDKKSGRTYYVNEETKARQWARPAKEARAVESAAASSVAVEDDDGLISYVLPPGWKELVDKKTGRTYYVNSDTKERQWRRPDNNHNGKSGIASGGNSNSAEDEIKQTNRLSRRLRGKETPAYLLEEQGGSFTAKAAAKVALARKDSALLLEAEAVADDKRNTVSYMCRIGTQNKKGFLSKQGKFIGRWKRRHFVLTDDLLEYWDRVQDYALGREGKTFFLSGSCLTSFTSTQNCFCVSNPSDDSDASSWYLLADSEDEMLDWMSAINAHIHMRYVAEWHITTDFWDRGNVETSFWKMPAASVKDVQRRPVGIRSLPINDGPRTGEGIYPGEIVEVVQIMEQPAARHVWAQRFLRLADDRGWVLENHPKANYAIMVPIPGVLIEDDTLRYVYSIDCLEELEVYNSPNCDEEHLTGLRLHPGAIVRAVAVWTTTIGAVSATVAAGEAPGEVTDGEDGSEELVFIKMADGKGWVPMYHPITGGQILTLISSTPTTKGVSTGNPTASIKPNSEPLPGPQPAKPPAAPPVTAVPPPPSSTTATAAPATNKTKASKREEATPADTEAAPARPALAKEKSVKASAKTPTPPAPPGATPAAPPPPPQPKPADSAASATANASAGSSKTSSKSSGGVAQKYKEGLASGASAKSKDSATAGSATATASGAASGMAASSEKKEASALDKPRRRVVKPIADS